MSIDPTTREGEKKARVESARAKAQKGESYGFRLARTPEGSVFASHRPETCGWRVWGYGTGVGFTVSGEGATLQLALMRRDNEIARMRMQRRAGGEEVGGGEGG